MVRVFPCSSAIFPHVRPASLPFKGGGGVGMGFDRTVKKPTPILSFPLRGKGKIGESPGNREPVIDH